MRSVRTLLSSFAALTAVVAASAAAHAQMDVNPPLPNVLLLIDTSGSMENMIDGNTPEADGAACVPGTTTPMNRWATLVSVLTGSIQNFSCQMMSRSASAFKSEYAFNGIKPYDADYYLPFHRLLSNGCTAGPGTAGLTWPGWPTGGIKFHSYTDPSTACATPWAQNSDGILDTYRDRVRFGLMTFDTLPDPSTGASGQNYDATGGMQGMWSYYLGWNGSGVPATGNPPNCLVHPFEVGARNPAAPPWEGRLIPFGPYDAPLATVQQTNDHVQQALVAMRAYGATPLAGMMADAKDFLLNDTSTDPSTNTPFGPGTDPYFTGGCRSTYIIILSDGEPNLDLEPDCEQSGNPNGKCPYAKPYVTASDLANNANAAMRVKTFVVGFGLSTANGIDCTTLTSTDVLEQSGSRCVGATGSLKACCTLGRIAYEGGSQRAYFASDLATLKSALAQVLSIVAAGSTSRTIPVFSSAFATGSAQGNAPASAYQFVSSFDANPGQLWTGNLERKRYVCQSVNGSLQATLVDIDSSKGDDFEADMNSESPSRTFFTVVGNTANNTIYSTRSIRPKLSTDDGLGIYTGTVTSIDVGATFASNLSSTPQALGINPTTPPSDCQTQLQTTNATQCANLLVRWETGQPNSGLTPTRAGNELGAIYHSTPAIQSPPRDYLRDESYANYAQQQAPRATMLYTATTDGQLHGFKVAANKDESLKVDSLANNELWSFFPPTVLPRLLGSYNQQAVLLDGAPVVKDVVFERTASSIATAAWHTVLVAGGGPGGGFYYALDATDPTKPQFLWQLSTDNSDAPLFGAETPPPGLATISLKDSTGAVREVAVAILAGGTAAQLSGSCARNIPVSTWTNVKPNDSSLGIRTSVHCWDTANKGARSVTIVRIDTGEVLMSFRGTATDGPSTLQSTRTKVVGFDSPMTGTPIATPSQPGEIADRVYVGDADGTLWRINLANPDPTYWTVELAWDAYALSSDTATMGQPIQTPPIISVDPVGNAVVLFSTGDQDMFTASAGVSTRIWSILEKPVGTKFVTSENWYIPFDTGKRVTGPISLFNSVAYFATFTPQSSTTNACADGFGSIWGVDYLQADATAGGPRPKPRFDPDLDPATPMVSYVDQPPGTVVFGVAVTQTPSCAATATVTDPYVGLAHVAPTSVSPAQFQLVFQTGQVGTKTQNSKTNTTTQNLPPPRQTTHIDSWATIVD